MRRGGFNESSLEVPTRLHRRLQTPNEDQMTREMMHTGYGVGGRFMKALDRSRMALWQCADELHDTTQHDHKSITAKTKTSYWLHSLSASVHTL